MKFQVAYQQGGTLNFKWRLMAGVMSEDVAAANVGQLRRMGYPARMLREGERLPDTFEPMPVTSFDVALDVARSY